MEALENQPYKVPAAQLAARLVEDVTDLVSPPDVCVKLFELMESGASIRDIGDVVSRDPSLTARLLRLANSSFYNFPQPVDTVSRAVTLIGIRELHGLVIAVSAIRSFTRLPMALVNIDTFWRHGIYSGLIARQLAKACGVLHPERLFIAGLLHDLGSLVLYSRMPEQMQELLLVADGDEDVLHHAELEALGFSHADLGRELARVWRLPDALQTAIGYHHTPLAAETSATEAAITHLADALANRSEIGAFCETSTGEAYIDAGIWQQLGLDAGEIDLQEIIGQAGLEFGETAALLLSPG